VGMSWPVSTVLTFPPSFKRQKVLIDTKSLPIRTQNRKAALTNCQDKSMVTKENHLSLGFEKTIGNKEA
jgi:hypothetical protein